MARSPAVSGMGKLAGKPSGRNAGKLRTSVALFLPRKLRLRRLSSASEVSRTSTSPVRPTTWRARLKKSVGPRVEGAEGDGPAEGEAEVDLCGGGLLGRSMVIIVITTYATKNMPVPPQRAYQES